MPKEFPLVEIKGNFTLGSEAVSLFPFHNQRLSPAFFPNQYMFPGMLGPAFCKQPQEPSEPFFGPAPNR
jgi:hypothetical protein